MGKVPWWRARLKVFHKVGASCRHDGSLLGQVDIWAQPMEVGDLAAAISHVGVNHDKEAFRLAGDQAFGNTNSRRVGSVCNVVSLLTFVQHGECTGTRDRLASRRKVICAISNLEWFGYSWYKTRRRLSRHNERLETDEKDSGNNHDRMKISLGMTIQN
jgi:hypothetical protein